MAAFAHLRPLARLIARALLLAISGIAQVRRMVLQAFYQVQLGHFLDLIILFPFVALRRRRCLLILCFLLVPR